jgi:hypothetical protein
VFSAPFVVLKIFSLLCNIFSVPFSTDMSSLILVTLPVIESRVPSLRVFISDEQTKETDEKVGSLFFVIAELLSETQVPQGLIISARRSVSLRRVKSKAPALRRNHAPHETQSEQNIYMRDSRKAGALLLTRRSGTLRRAEIFDIPVVGALRATPCSASLVG